MLDQAPLQNGLYNNGWYNVDNFRSNGNIAYTRNYNGVSDFGNTGNTREF